MDCFGFDLEHLQRADKVELPRFHDRRRKAGVEEEELLPDERREIPAERRRIGDDLRGALFEGDEHAGFAAAGAVDQRLQRKDRLTAPRSPQQQRRPPEREPSAGYFIKPLDPGEAFGDSGLSGKVFHS